MRERERERESLIDTFYSPKQSFHHRRCNLQKEMLAQPTETLFPSKAAFFSDRLSCFLMGLSRLASLLSFFFWSPSQNVASMVASLQITSSSSRRKETDGANEIGSKNVSILHFPSPIFCDLFRLNLGNVLCNMSSNNFSQNLFRNF